MDSATIVPEPLQSDLAKVHNLCHIGQLLGWSTGDRFPSHRKQVHPYVDNFLFYFLVNVHRQLVLSTIICSNLVQGGA